MEKSEFRAVIKHLYLKGLTSKKIKAKLDKVYATSAPVFATVYNWVNEFKLGRISTKDEHHSGRPVEVTTPEMIDKIHDIVLSEIGRIYRDYLEKGQTITGVYYASLLHQLREEIEKKRPHLKEKKILFHQDNARVHTCAISTAKFIELKFELLQHPLYSPDLAASDFFLFPNLKTWLRGQRFTSNEEVVAQKDAYFEDLPKSYFLDDLKKL